MLLRLHQSLFLVVLSPIQPMVAGNVVQVSIPAKKKDVIEMMFMTTKTNVLLVIAASTMLCYVLSTMCSITYIFGNESGFGIAEGALGISWPADKAAAQWLIASNTRNGFEWRLRMPAIRLLPEIVQNSTYAGISIPLWPIVLFLSWAVGRRMLFDKMNRCNCCPKCMYDTRGLSDRCPECGEKIQISSKSNNPLKGGGVARP